MDETFVCLQCGYSIRYYKCLERLGSPRRGEDRGDTRTGFLRKRRSQVDSLGVSLLFSGRGSAFQQNMVASNVTSWLRSETRVWIGNKQARTFLQPQLHRKRNASRKRSGREGGWERERLEGNQGRFYKAVCLPYSCTW
jgi:hypothetical protein